MFFSSEDGPTAKVVVCSNINDGIVTLSYKGHILEWKWDNRAGLISPGAQKPIPIHPIASEVIVEMEVGEFLGLEGIDEDEVAYVNQEGNELAGVVFQPACLGKPTFAQINAKERLKDAFASYMSNGGMLTEEHIGSAISVGSLGAFLSLINL